MERVVVVCPGRGSYTKDSLGYLQGEENKPYLKTINQWRQDMNDPTVSFMDQQSSFSPSLHMKGEHASPLIYACSLADFLKLNRERFEVVAVTGNSMGWYIALAVAGVLKDHAAFHVIQTMGGMMREKVIGGQIIYPLVDDNWQLVPSRMQEIEGLLTQINAQSGCEVYTSIYLGGYVVLAGNDEGLRAITKALPALDNFPMRLLHHAAFHTPLLHGVTARALEQIPAGLFTKPDVHLIDGRGHIWSPYATDLNQIYEYTVGAQVTQSYNFTKAIEVAVKEFAPDRLVLLGPGNSLGAPVGQTLVSLKWQGMTDKARFLERQKSEPFVISMGLPEQRQLVI